MKLRARVKREDYYDGYSLMLWGEDVNVIYRVKPLEFEIWNDHEAVPEPTLFVSKKDIRMGNNVLQELMNELWREGLRPADDVGSVGELKSTKYHLEDMRKLVFEHSVTKKTDRG